MKSVRYILILLLIFAGGVTAWFATDWIFEPCESKNSKILSLAGENLAWLAEISSDVTTADNCESEDDPKMVFSFDDTKNLDLSSQLLARGWSSPGESIFKEHYTRRYDDLLYELSFSADGDVVIYIRRQ